MKQIIGVMIQQHLDDSGATQTTFAEKIGTDQQAVSRWIRGINVPERKWIKELARVIRVPVDEIRNGIANAYALEPEERLAELEKYIAKHGGVPAPRRKKSDPLDAERVANTEAQVAELQEQVAKLIKTIHALERKLDSLG